MSMEDRKQQACEYISSDEGFWGDFMEIDEDTLEDYYAKAEEKAEEIAESTKAIEDEDKAWETISTKINEYKKELRKELEKLL